MTPPINTALAAYRTALPHPEHLPPDVDTLLAYLHTHLFEPDLTVATALRACGLSSARIHDRFRRYLRHTIHAYVERRRIEAARHLLHLDAGRFSEVALAVGYENYTTFCRAFRRRTGTTPGAWKENDGTK